VEVYLHVFLTAALAGGDLPASRSDRLSHGKRAPCTQWIGGWVGPRTGLDDMEKRKILPLPGLKFRSLGRPVSIQSLYWLPYPGSLESGSKTENKTNARANFTHRGAHWTGDCVGPIASLETVEKRQILGSDFRCAFTSHGVSYVAQFLLSGVLRVRNEKLQEQLILTSAHFSVCSFNQM
jgi:hypothetical protein